MLSSRQMINGKLAFSVHEAITKFHSLPAITLPAEEAGTFIEWAWDQSMLKNYARLETMADQTKNVRGLGFGDGRFFVPEGKFDAAKVKTTFAEDTVQLSTKEFRAAILIKDSDLEDINVTTEAAFKAHLMSIVTKKMAEELEEIAWISDAQSLSGFAEDDARGELDGWRYGLDHSQSGEAYENSVTGSTILLDASNTITGKAASFAISSTDGIVETDSSAPYHQDIKFGLMKKYMPSEYKKGGVGNLRYFVNDQILDDYTQQLQARGTPVGDTAIFGQNFKTYGGIPIIPVPLLPTTMKIDTVDTQKEVFTAASGTTATGGDLTDALLTVNQNLMLGIQLKIIMEPERSAADRGTFIYFTMRIDAKNVDVHAAVLCKRLKVL